MPSLVDILSEYYPTAADARGAAERAEINIARVDLGGHGINAWLSVLREAYKSRKLDAIIEILLNDYYPPKDRDPYWYYDDEEEEKEKRAHLQEFNSKPNCKQQKPVT